ncbi:hypothetical protein Scep_011465 [Stephania cephalantha]|uniref:Uncharacterized protein n=1 Tax=Stephania cephalantha TaxID=152367 RepID=A0AAP0JD22_9MAGN
MGPKLQGSIKRQIKAYIVVLLATELNSIANSGEEEDQQVGRERFSGLVKKKRKIIKLGILESAIESGVKYYAKSKENVNVDTLKNVEANEVTQVENYWSKIAEGLEVLQIEQEIVIVQNEEEENKMKTEVISKKPEEPQIESKEDQPLVFVKPPTLPCIFVKPYTGVEMKERSQIFNTTDTFVLDDHDSTYSFVLEVPNKLPSPNEGVHISLPNAIVAPFVVDISKGEGIT